LKNNRTLASESQERKCCYCYRPMWDGDPETLRPFCREQGLTKRQAALRRCTAEHLVALADGGTSRKSNIAAACTYCNRQRHQRKVALAPKDFRERVLKRLRMGRWSP
jgi:5-methylcytosine-specific restriction endonuclease McrA